MDAYEFTPNAAPSFGKQFLSALLPFYYGTYRDMTKKQGKAFVRGISFLYVAITYVVHITIILINPTAVAAILDGSNSTVRTLQHPVFIILYGAGMLVTAFLYPFIYRFCAWLLRLPGKLVCKIFHKDIQADHLYLVSLYAMVPVFFLQFIPFFFIGFPLLYDILLILCDLFSIIISVLYMCVGIFYIE
ncbi:MAG: hypothetical protein J1E61_02350 [Lachnospiraceae bacterium]|nr:hypothetical protein [Lachnospiraceae bacterium]